MIVLRSANSWTKYFERYSNIDLVFICGNVQVKAHKTIFATISKYVKEIVLANTQDVVYISLPDVNHKHLQKLVNFLYEGSAKLNVKELVSFKELLTLLAIHISNADIQMTNKPVDPGEVVTLHQVLNALPTSRPTADVDPVQPSGTANVDPLQPSGTADVDPVQKPICKPTNDQPNVPDVVDVKVKEEFVTQNENFLNENENVPPSNSKLLLTDEDMIRNNINVLKQALLVPAHTIVPNSNISTYTSVVNSTVPCLQTLTVENSGPDKSGFPKASSHVPTTKTISVLKSSVQPADKDDDDDDVILINGDNNPVIEIDPLSPAGLGFTCSFCNITYSASSYLENHSKVCKKKIRAFKVHPFTCTVCKSSFSQRHKLLTHMRHHLGERPHKCELCDAKFTTLPALKNHILVHTGERSYKCEFCEKTFRQPTHLRCHVRVHTGDKPYMCKVCGQTFTRSEGLKSHFRIHTGERAYKCDSCNQSFNYYNELSKHKKVHKPLRTATLTL